MKIKKIIEISKKMNMNTSDLLHDLQAITKLSRDFQNKLDEILIKVSIHVDDDITSYDKDKEKWLKLISEEQFNKNKQYQLNKLEYYTFLRQWLDYPVIESSLDLQL